MRGAPFSRPPRGGRQDPPGGRSTPVTISHEGRRPRSGQLRPEVVLLGWRRTSFSSPEQYLMGCGSPHTSRAGPMADPGPAAPSPATPPHLAAVPSQHKGSFQMLLNKVQGQRADWEYPFCGCCYQHFIHADPDIGSTFNCSIFKVRSPFLCFK